MHGDEASSLLVAATLEPIDRAGQQGEQKLLRLYPASNVNAVFRRIDSQGSEDNSRRITRAPPLDTGGRSTFGMSAPRAFRVGPASPLVCSDPRQRLGFIFVRPPNNGERYDMEQSASKPSGAHNAQTRGMA